MLPPLRQFLKRTMVESVVPGADRADRCAARHFSFRRSNSRIVAIHSGPFGIHGGAANQVFEGRLVVMMAADSPPPTQRFARISKTRRSGRHHVCRRNRPHSHLRDGIDIGPEHECAGSDPAAHRFARHGRWDRNLFEPSAGSGGACERTEPKPRKTLLHRGPDDGWRQQSRAESR